MNDPYIYWVLATIAAFVLLYAGAWITLRKDFVNIQYKGFTAQVGLTGTVYIGRVQAGPHVLQFSADERVKLDSALMQCIEGYLAYCKQKGIQPVIPEDPNLN